MSGKKVGSGTITANFHRAELRKLPGVEVGRALGEMFRCRRAHFRTAQKRRTEQTIYARPCYGARWSNRGKYTGQT